MISVADPGEVCWDSLEPPPPPFETKLFSFHGGISENEVISANPAPLYTSETSFQKSWISPLIYLFKLYIYHNEGLTTNAGNQHTYHILINTTSNDAGSQVDTASHFIHVKQITIG